MSSDLAELEAALGYTFTSADLLVLALTHPSMARTRAERDQTNQRLEFLGDRVLGLVVAGMLYEAYPGEEEGAMARRHTALVRRETLARVAGDLNLAVFIRMAASEEESGGRENAAILADTCEAIIAAIFLDGGLGSAEAFIRQRWQDLMAEDLKPPKDAKTALQEYAQSKAMNLPQYKEISRDGPPHSPIFTIEASIDNEEAVTGTGSSKRQAEQMAAEELLARLGRETTT